MLEGPMYAVGGHDGWSYLNTVERWDPQARQWNYVASMSTPRSTMGVTALNGKWVHLSNLPVIFIDMSYLVAVFCCVSNILLSLKFRSPTSRTGQDADIYGQFIVNDLKSQL